MSNFSLRPATTADLDFLDRVHTICMKPHVEKLYPWKPYYFRETFDASLIDVIVVGAADAGMLKISEDGEVIHLRQISLLPEFQNRGIGRAIVDLIVAEARRRGLPVRLQVLKLNPARRLYERLGFGIVAETATHYIMST